ncbi:hypothetical protein ACJZ2D_013992 [Fusarium nematophilum]
MALTDFFLWRVSNPTVSEQVLKSLVSALEAVRDGEDTRAKQPHALVLQLLPFEKKLLASMLEHLSQDDREAATASSVPLDLLATHTFHKWSRASAVLRQVHVEFESDALQEMHGGKQTAAFEMVKEMLRSRHTRVASDRRYYRTEQLVEDSQDFVSRLGYIDPDQINIAPHQQDLPLWRMIALLFVRNLEVMRAWEGFRTIVGLFSRSKSQQQGAQERFEVSAERDDLLNPLLATAFAPALDAEIRQQGAILRADPVLVLEDPDPENIRLFTMAKQKFAVDLMTETIDVWDVWVLERLVRLHLNETELRVPGFPTQDFVGSTAVSAHWEEANLQLQREGREATVLFPKKKFDLEAQRPRYEFVQLDKFETIALRYEQRIFDRQISNPASFLPFINWADLNLVTAEQAEGAIDSLGLPRSSFSDGELKVWITSNRSVSTNLLYVNEDLYLRHIVEGYEYPGHLLNGRILFRCRELDKTPFPQELNHFWMDWNDVAITRDPDKGRFFLLETLPGIKARELKQTSSDSGPITFFDFKWRHRHQLDRQRDELQAVLGEHFKPSYCDFLLLSLDHVEEQLGNVAIKVSHALPSKEGQSDAKFFAELATSYQALSGNGNLAGLVRLFGIVKVLVDPATGEMCNPKDEGSRDAQPRLALVFDYASGGNLIDYLAKDSAQEDPYEVWGNLCTYFADIAKALKDIHSRGIVHRDLHQGNVLVQVERKKGSEEPEEYCLISDLGEGKVLDTDYAAPEISDGRFTASSDIFAWAQLFLEAIRVSHGRLSWEDGQVRYPKRLMTILEACLSDDPEKRISAAKLEDMIQNVSLEMIREVDASGVEWFLGSYELPRVAKRLSTSLELSDAWFRSS